MTRKELRTTLLSIQSLFEGELIKDSAVDDYVECLNNKNLAKHLTDTEMCPLEEDLPDYLKDYESAEKIINEFLYGIECTSRYGITKFKY